jgi:hypothetical protein
MRLLDELCDLLGGDLFQTALERWQKVRLEQVRLPHRDPVGREIVGDAPFVILLAESAW